MHKLSKILNHNHVLEFTRALEVIPMELQKIIPCECVYEFIYTHVHKQNLSFGYIKGDIDLCLVVLESSDFDMPCRILHPN